MSLKLKAQFDWAEVKIIRSWAAVYFSMPKTRPSNKERDLLNKIMECDREMSREWREKISPFQYDEKGNN